MYVTLKQRRLNRPTRTLDRRDAFSTIYATNGWGGAPGTFWSGPGSLQKYQAVYQQIVGEQVQGLAQPTIVDLGCGDFRVGAVVRPEHARYIGVDIVPELIEHNRRNHATDLISFECLDAAQDTLPQGDVCLIRQVLQHLSNSEIAAVLQNLTRYPIVIVTEAFPPPGRPTYQPNRDIPHGACTRVFIDSAVDLRYPPFWRADARVLAEVPVETDDYTVEPGEHLKIFEVCHPAKT